MTSQEPLPTPSPKELLTEEQQKSLIHRDVKKGDILYREGEESRGIYYVCEGLFGLTRISENGAESLLRVFPNCSYLGHRSFLAEERYHASAQALKNSKVFFIPKDIATKLLLDCPPLLMVISKLMARDLKVAEMRLTDMVGKRAFSRVAESLIFLKHKNEEFAWTRREIGEFSGVKTETVSRILSELEDLGHIKKEGRQIIITNEDALLLAIQEV